MLRTCRSFGPPIATLGCGAIVTLPGSVAGDLVATVNLLHEELFYTPARVARSAALNLPANAAFLAT